MDYKKGSSSNARYLCSFARYINRNENLAVSICPQCKKRLGYFAEKINEASLIEAQKSLYEDWKVLDLFEDKRQSVDISLSKGKYLASKLIYVAQDCNEILDRSKITGINADYLSRLLSYIRESEADSSERKLYSVTLPLLLKVLRIKKTSVSNFINIKLPQTFVQNLLFENQIGGCLTPWCKSYKSNKKLLKLNYSQSKRHQHDFYRNPHLCLDCGIIHGSNKNGVWREAGDMVSLAANNVAPLLNSGISRFYIAKLNQLSRFQVEQIFGFILRHKLVNEHILNKYISNFTCQETAEKFLALESLGGSKIRNSAKLFGWGQLEYHYYFYDPQIQDLLHLGKQSKIKKVTKPLEKLVLIVMRFKPLRR